MFFSSLWHCHNMESKWIYMLVGEQQIKKKKLYETKMHCTHNQTKTMNVKYVAVN